MFKAQKLCAYRERCVSEIESKLSEWGLNQSDSDQVIDELVENDFINEKRFANSYARGKFIINKWGKFKIQLNLREKKINEQEIVEALKKLDEKEYQKTAKALIAKKWEDLNGTEDRLRRSKVYYYMLSKGYESDLIFKLMK